MYSAHDCLRDLEKLSHEGSSDSRRRMLHRITDLFFATTDQQQQADIDVFGAVMVHLASELEVEARQELAERMAPAERAPRELIVQLAHDEIQIARPVIQHSPSLTEEDLVKIAGEQSQEHLAVLSEREQLAPAITDLIVERGDSIVLATVARNETASFSNEGIGILSERSVGNENIREALISRKDMPQELISGIKKKVAEKLRAELADSNPGISDDEINSVVDDKAGHIENDQAAEQQLSLRKVEWLHQNKQLDEDMIVNYARGRAVEECILALSLQSGLSINMVSHCLLEADLPALGILCKSNNFKDNTFAAVLQLRLIIKGMPSNLALNEMKRYQNLTHESAQRVMRFLKVRMSEPTNQ